MKVEPTHPAPVRREKYSEIPERVVFGFALRFHAPRRAGEGVKTPQDTLKTCRKLQKNGAFRGFSARSESVGRSSWCRGCHNDATHSWRSNSPKRVAGYNAARRVVHEPRPYVSSWPNIRITLDGHLLPGAEDQAAELPDAFWHARPAQALRRGPRAGGCLPPKLGERRAETTVTAVTSCSLGGKHEVHGAH
jgi:hypothetical protein